MVNAAGTISGLASFSSTPTPVALAISVPAVAARNAGPSGRDVSVSAPARSFSACARREERDFVVGGVVGGVVVVVVAVVVPVVVSARVMSFIPIPGR